MMVNDGLAPFVTSASEDLMRGLRRWDVFTRLGWREIMRRYRRTLLGPFWGAISLSVFVAALGTVGRGLWSLNYSDYLPFLAAGMMVWVLISVVMTEAGSLFLARQNLFSQMKMDYSILAYSLVWHNIIVFLHNLCVYSLFVVLFAPHILNFNVLLVVPGIALLALNCVWITLLLGMACLRFRDLQQLIATIVQVSMFVTPIFWPPKSLQGVPYLIFVELNPIYNLIEIVRAPLLGLIPDGQVYVSAIILTVVGWSITFVIFRIFRKRIAYWV